MFVIMLLLITGSLAYAQTDRADPQADHVYDKADRLFLVSWAPPASGKTSAMNFIVDRLEIEKALDVRVDDLMREIAEYRQTSKLLKQAALQSRVKRSKQAFEVFCRLSGALYFPQRPRAERYGNALLFGQLVKPRSLRQHILFELTASDGAMIWLGRLARLFRDEGYRVHLVVPVARSVRQLYERAWARLMNPSNEEFRLPCPDRISAFAREATRNTAQLLRRHLQPDSREAFVVDGMSLIDCTVKGKAQLAFEVMQGRVTHRNDTLLSQPHFAPYHAIINE